VAKRIGIGSIYHRNLEPGTLNPNFKPGTLNFERRSWLACVVIVLATLAAYHNSFSGPFILDDLSAITANPSIKHFVSALSPPANSTAAGRPLLSLSFALNYALGGFNVWGYHAFNLLVHTLAGLTLFGVVRRTLLFPSGCGQGVPTLQRAKMRGGDTPPTTEYFEADATLLALAVAVLWTVHPLQTEAVTYISQRAESLMGLFYLLTLYCFLRSVENRYQASGVRYQETRIRSHEQGIRSKEKPSEGGSNSALQSFSSSVLWWRLASIFCCLLGSMTKENIVTAPVIILLYDRTFVAGTFREACRLHWRYYLGLAATWMLLACLMVSLNQRGVGFDQGVSWWHYALTSCRSVVLYLKLTVWPHPLVLDYGSTIIRHATDVLPYGLILFALLAVVVIALWRRPVIGFAGAWFFIILVPTSSVVPVALQPMAEHRLYLSLAAVVVLVVLGLYRLIGRRSLLVCAVAAVGLGWLSVQRNKDYRSELTMWSDTVAKCPDNERALYNLGNLLAKTPNRGPEAIAAFQAALQINPDYAEAHNNYGNALLKLPGRLADAIAQFQTALRLNPGYADAHNDLGTALLDLPGRLPDAIAQYEAALQIKPDYVEANYNLGNALAQSGRLSDAIAHYETAVRIAPDLVEVHISLGRTLAQIPGRLPDAIAEYEIALRLQPDSVETHYNLGNVFFQANQLSDALGEYQIAIQLKPDYAEAHNNLGNALAELGRLSEAIGQYEEALRINPDYVNARQDMEQVQKAMAAGAK
jgi:tetratricopeptide (TPR) repeat protein